MKKKRDKKRSSDKIALRFFGEMMKRTNSNHKKVTSGVIPQKVQTREEFILPRPCNEQNGTKTMGLDQIEP